MLVETDLSPKTITEYGARSDRLRSACAHALDVDVERLAWTPFVAWLFDQKPRWSANTWNMYKSSVRYALSRACDDDQDDVDVSTAIATLKRKSEIEPDKSSLRTSATKAKQFPLADRRRVFAELTLSRSVKAAELADFIRATCASGLRPTEWRTASLVTPDEGFRVQLVVTNAKAGHGRTHGPTRTLRWKNLSIETEKAIERTLDIARSFSSDKNYEAYRKRIQDLLHAVSLRLWPERKLHFALYSCRHAAIADAKSIYTRAEVAALFGHATDGSCMSGYPRKKGTSSKGGLDADAPLELPIPDPNEVARVLLRADTSLARLSRLADRADSNAAQPASAAAIDDALHEETMLDPFPEPPRRSEGREDAQERAGAELWRAYSEKKNAEFDELDRAIARLRDRKHGREPQGP